MKKSRRVTTAISLLLCSQVVSGTVITTLSCTQALAARTRATAPSATLLPPKILALANVGDWLEVISQLESLTAGETAPSRNDAWLAFAYMFNSKCKELKDLSSRVEALKETGDPASPKLVQTFNLICQQKYDDAGTLVATIADADKDVLLNLALAAVAAKKGNPKLAVTHTQKVIELAPDFVWGYRTLGFIQDKSLKDRAAAQAAYQQAFDLQPKFHEVRDLLVDAQLAQNDFDGAIDTSDAAIAAAPKDASNLYRLSQIFTQQWRLREANDQLDRAIKLSPDVPRYHRAKASILRYQKQLDAAIAEQELAVELSTDKSFELIELAALNELAGKDDIAIAKLKEALTLAPKNQAAQQKLVALLLKNKRYDDLAQEYRRQIAAQPKISVLRLGLAQALIKTGKVDEAIVELKEAANLDGADPRPHRELGAIFIERKNFADAARSYTRALNINPGSVDDLVALGYTYAQNQDYLQAETAFITALALQQLTQGNVNRMDLMKSLAVLLLTEGKYAEAATNLESITATEKNTPSNALNEFLLAQAKALRDRSSTGARELQQKFEALGEKDKSQQKAALIETFLRLEKPDMAIEQLALVSPDSIKGDSQWMTLSSMSWRVKGDLSKAEQLANQAISVKDDNAENQSDAYMELGQVLLAKGDTNGAETAARKAIDLNSKSFASQTLLGKIYLKKGDFKRAIEAGKRSLEINPYYTQGYLLTGDAYAASNKFDEAASNYKRAVELYPAWIEAHRSLRDVYKKLAQKEEAQKEEEIIVQIQKRS